MKIRNDANTSINVIDAAGNSTKYERVLQSDTPLTPGCIVVPFVGTALPVTGAAGDTGAVKAPDSAGNLPVSVLDLSSVDGMNLIGEYKQGDQVPVLSAGGRSSVVWNVRIAATEVVTENQLLTRTTDGSGFVTATGADEDNAIGIAREDIVSGDPALPTFIKMEVL